MRKAVLVPIIALLGVILVLAGCAGPAGPTTVALGQSVTLSPNQTVDITGENLRITFLNVITDSRCPTGAT